MELTNTNTLTVQDEGVLDVAKQVKEHRIKENTKANILAVGRWMVGLND